MHAYAYIYIYGCIHACPSRLFVPGLSFRVDDDESEGAGMDYAEQTQLIAKKAKIALMNRQIEDLKKAKKTISTDYASADAQLALAEVGRICMTTKQLSAGRLDKTFPLFL